jgi:hypothetical protein
MTFFEKLKAHVGGLVHLKTDLYWYDSFLWDGNEGRVCLLLDVGKIIDTTINGNIGFNPKRLGLDTAGVATVSILDTRFVFIVFLLIDGSPQQVWITEDAMEIIQ